MATELGITHDLSKQSWLDDSLNDLLIQAFEAMDELVPNVGARVLHKGKITKEKGIIVSEFQRLDLWYE